MGTGIAEASGTGEAFWIDSPGHRRWLARDALRALDFFRPSIRDDGGFHTLDVDGTRLRSDVQELHTTTRLVHSFALGHMAGVPDCAGVIDAGMRYLVQGHRDAEFEGYLWARDGTAIKDDRKLAYGHVFVLLAASSALLAGHPEADALVLDATSNLDRHFWEDGPGLFADEWTRDWLPFSDYRGLNANMHGVEALLAAFEATGREVYLERAGRILDFFMGRVAPQNGWRLPEHYHADWTVDPSYSGDPMFRPAGTTPGHSFELSRLALQHWDLAGRPDSGAPEAARRVTMQALANGWDEARGGGIFYTLELDGSPAIRDRYWWPMTEAIGVLASLVKLERKPEDEAWYRRLWTFADTHFVDPAHGGWFHEIDGEGRPASTQFKGKPDIYHALQADLFPLAQGLSRQAAGLPKLAEVAA